MSSYGSPTGFTLNPPIAPTRISVSVTPSVCPAGSRRVAAPAPPVQLNALISATTATPAPTRIRRLIGAPLSRDDADRRCGRSSPAVGPGADAVMGQRSGALDAHRDLRVLESHRVGGLT